MADAFVSYSRADQRFVDGIMPQLESMKVTAWLDRRDLPPSLPWMEEIKDAIADSIVFVVIDTPAWRSSAHCRAESALADDARLPRLHLDPSELDYAEAADAVRSARYDSEGGRADAAAVVARPARIWNRLGRPWSLVPTTIDFWLALLAWILHREAMPRVAVWYLVAWAGRLALRGLGWLIGAAALICLAGSVIAIMVILYLAAKSLGL